MPFTPFHLGAGLLLKGAAPPRVSLTAFAVTQVVVDLEPLYFIMRGEYPVHRALHTLVGAGAAGLAVGGALWALARRRSDRLPPLLREDLARGAALAGGLLGGLSHPLLDGLMHRDVRALRPFAETTWVLAPRGVLVLHAALVIAGLAGALLWMARRARA